MSGVRDGAVVRRVLENGDQQSGMIIARHFDIMKALDSGNPANRAGSENHRRAYRVS